MTSPSKPSSSRSRPVRYAREPVTGTPSMSTYAGMMPRALPSRITISNGTEWTSRSSRGPIEAESVLRPPALAL